MGCCLSADEGPPANFSLGDPQGFRKVQGWDADQQKIVREGDGASDTNSTATKGTS